MSLERLVKKFGTSFAAPHGGSEVDKINAALTAVDGNVVDIATNAGDIVTNGNAIDTLSDEVDTGVIGQARLICTTLPTATNTISIGADVYEADGVGANINFTIVALDPAATLANLIAAINTSGTEDVFASVDAVVATVLVIENADAPGGTPTVGTASVVLAQALTPAGNIWDQTNLNATGHARFTYRAEGVLVIDAVNVLAVPVIELAFTPTELEWATYATTGAPIPTTATGVITAGQIVFTPGAGGTPLIATDCIVWKARG